MLLLSSSNRKYPHFPLLSYFFRGCVPVCDIIFCHLLHISSGETGNLLSLLLCSLWWVQIVGYVLACRSYFVCLCSIPSHYHHWANLIYILLYTRVFSYEACRYGDHHEGTPTQLRYQRLVEYHNECKYFISHHILYGRLSNNGSSYSIVCCLQGKYFSVKYVSTLQPPT